MKIALDAYGTDSGPEVVMEGARIAAADGIVVRVFGPASLEASDGVEVVPTGGWIANDADPVAAVRSTPGASVVMAAADVAVGRSAAMVSAGSTGATMTAALFALKRLRGVHRPALAAQVPLPGGGRHDALPRRRGEHRGPPPAPDPVRLPRLGLQPGGARASSGRGWRCCRSARSRRRGTPTWWRPTPPSPEATAIEFIGNVEGRDLLTGAADVIVTDGFTGNVTLKTLEGTAKAVAGAVRDAARSGPVAAAGGLLLRPALGGLRRGLDPNAVGGAVLLGLRGVAVVAHGSSTPEGIANAVRLADHAVRERAVERTAESLRESGATREGLREAPVVTGGEER